MKFHIVRPSAAILGVALALAAAACSSSQDSAATSVAAPALVRNLEKTSITVDDFPSVDSAGLYIAQLDGFFRDEGLNVKINEVFSGSQQTVSAIENGSADISSADYVTYLDNELLQHAKLRIIAEASTLQPSQLEMLVAHGSTINKVKELAGKKIAVAGHDDIATLLIDSLLTENNVPLRDVQIEPGFALPAIPALLNKHVIDAGPVPEPFVSEGQENLGVQSLADLDQGATLNFPIQGFAVTQAWAQQNPNTLRAFVAALDRGTGGRRHQPPRGRAGDREVPQRPRDDRRGHGAAELPALGRPAAAPARRRRHGPVRLRARVGLRRSKSAR